MAILGIDQPTPIHWLRTGMMQSRRVGRVRIDDRPIGSAFYVDGKDIDPRLTGVPLLLTTLHLFGHGNAWEMADVAFDGLVDDPSASVSCRLQRLLWSSPLDELDAAVFVLDGEPGQVDDFAIAPSSPKYNEPVYIFGYPWGGGMTFSRLDNLVLGEEGNEILYRAPTAPGSSGSPVFNDHWEAVAMHRAYVTHPPANRGMKIGPIIDAIRAAMDHIAIGPEDRAATKATATTASSKPDERQFFSVFVSYSHADKLFARRLTNDLLSLGIRAWLDEHQILPGDDIYDQVRRGIAAWDKILLCCSSASLSSWWVDNELDQAFQKEQRLMKERGRKVLAVVPLDLDGYLFGDWPSGKAPQLRTRLAADFRGWESDEIKYQNALAQVVKALRADSGAREAPPGALL